jgi:hypothetical protein
VGDLLKIVGFLSVGVGPFLSDKVPAMPPDLRPWAFWVSGVTAFVGLIWTKVRLKDPVDPNAAESHLKFTGVGALVFAFSYCAIALFWTSEAGDWRDGLFRFLSVVVYGLCFACVTALAVAGEKLAK